MIQYMLLNFYYLTYAGLLTTQYKWHFVIRFCWLLTSLSVLTYVHAQLEDFFGLETKLLLVSVLL